MTAVAQKTRTAALVVLAFLCLAAAIGTGYLRERNFPRPASVEDVLYFQNGTALSRMALGYDAILADVYWIRSVLYFGGQKRADRARRSHDLLYPLLDITTTLDPKFNIAYRFGAIFLAEGYPAPPGRPDLAVKLLEKGFAANPTKWQYLYDAAFVYYWWVRDYRAAARWFEKASRVPGAPEWLPGLAAVTLATGGDRRAARFMWRQILESADAEYMRENARRRLEQLDAMDQLDALDAALDRVAHETGTRPLTWQPLADRGWLRHNPPVDPAGTPYRIDPSTGHTAVSPDSPLYPLPNDIPRRASAPAAQGPS